MIFRIILLVAVIARATDMALDLDVWEIEYLQGWHVAVTALEATSSTTPAPVHVAAYDERSIILEEMMRPHAVSPLEMLGRI